MSASEGGDLSGFWEGVEAGDVGTSSKDLVARQVRVQKNVSPVVIVDPSVASRSSDLAVGQTEMRAVSIVGRPGTVRRKPGFCPLVAESL